MTMKPFITTDYTELQSNPGTTSNRTGPVQRYSLNYLDQNWRFINDKIPHIKLKDSNCIRNEVAEVEKLTIDERILELEESSLVERAFIERKYESLQPSESIQELSKSLKIIKAFLGDRRHASAFPSISTPTSGRKAYSQHGNQNWVYADERSNPLSAPATARPSSRRIAPTDASPRPRSRPKTTNNNLRVRTAPSVEVAAGVDSPRAEQPQSDNKTLQRLAVTQEQILQLDISKQFKRFTAENGFRSPLCLSKLTVVPDKVEEEDLVVAERPLSQPAGRVSVTVVPRAAAPTTPSTTRNKHSFGNKGRRIIVHN